MFVHACHCRDCQKQTGGPFAINGLIEFDCLELTQGQPDRVTLPTDSGYPHDVYYCAACRSALWSDYGRRGFMLFVRLATLDAPGEFIPDVHIYTVSKLPFVILPEGARAFQRYYKVPAEWPAESLARRAGAEARWKARG